MSRDNKNDQTPTKPLAVGSSLGFPFPHFAATMNPFFRRSASFLANYSPSSTRVLTSILSNESFRFLSTDTRLLSLSGFPTTISQPSLIGFSSLLKRHVGFGFRGLHSNFSTQNATAECDYEDQSQQTVNVSEDGLEIAKLGIAESIVKELEKKGITKLFPIQV